MNLVNFIYSPRHGPLWISGAGPRENIGLPVVEWENHSCHAVGLQVSVDATEWRDAARAEACEVALRCRGLAWDQRGMVSVIVPLGPGGTAYEPTTVLQVLWLVRYRETGRAPVYNHSIWGTPHLTPDDYALAQVKYPSLVLHAGAPWEWTWTPVSRGVIFRRPGGEYTITSPWRRTAIYGASAAGEER